MTEDEVIPLSRRVGQLFLSFHARDEPEQTLDGVAQAVSTIAGRQVSAHYLASLRAGDCDHGDPEPQVMTALAHHFGVHRDYLLGDAATAARIDQQLRLLEAARNAGLGADDLVRCGPSAADIETLIVDLAARATKGPRRSEPGA
ncbi:hypothetical protein [Nocardia carnea]|uniref:hypothetical protein n=1 Tax=Nocardia carnea TaxID=37328 RepID=UPI0024580069|nr:hypothetical protein [Nocardia carnea]